MQAIIEKTHTGGLKSMRKHFCAFWVSLVLTAVHVLEVFLSAMIFGRIYLYGISIRLNNSIAVPVMVI